MRSPWVGADTLTLAAGSLCSAALGIFGGPVWEPRWVLFSAAVILALLALWTVRQERRWRDFVARAHRVGGVGSPTDRPRQRRRR